MKLSFIQAASLRQSLDTKVEIAPLLISEFLFLLFLVVAGAGKKGMLLLRLRRGSESLTTLLSFSPLLFSL